MTMRKIKKGDEVVVLKGKSRGHRGKILSVISDGRRVLVEGANIVKKHVKPNPNMNEPGGILEREAPIVIENVAIYNPVTKKADRIGFRILPDGRKVRYFKSNGEQVEN